MHDAAGQERDGACDDERTKKQHDHGAFMPADSMLARRHDGHGKGNEREDRQEME
jgi:hypothetical protein